MQYCHVRQLFQVYIANCINFQKQQQLRNLRKTVLAMISAKKIIPSDILDTTYNKISYGQHVSFLVFTYDVLTTDKFLRNSSYNHQF